MRVIVTGAAGFIGTHLSNRLLKDGHTVVGVDNLTAGLRENLDPRVEFHCEDIRSHDIYPLFEGAGAVFHLAAKNCLFDCLQDPVATAEINVAGTANVLEAARRAGASRLVYADTSAEYEGVLEFPSRVDRIEPLSVYARSKRAGALFCDSYRQFHGLHVTMVRYFNVYGPVQDWRRSIPPLMSAFISKMLKAEAPIIYGTGKKRRDYIYVDDVTNFNIMALFDPRTDGGVFNVGSGVNHSVYEIFEAVEAILKTGLQPIYKDELPGEAETTLADIQTELKLGWRPQTDLIAGIHKSIEYIRVNVIGESHSSGRG